MPTFISRDFLTTLDERDEIILTMHIDGKGLKRIAERVGYKTHSAVSKRLKVIAKKMWEYYFQDS